MYMKLKDFCSCSDHPVTLQSVEACLLLYILCIVYVTLNNSYFKHRMNVLFIIAGGQLELTSDPPTYGSYCPGLPVTLTCRGTNTAASFQWALNGIDIAVFQFAGGNAMFPMVLFSNESINSSVISAGPGSSLNSIDFRSTLTVYNIDMFLGSSIVCKTFADQSLEIYLRVQGKVINELLLNEKELLYTVVVSVKFHENLLLDKIDIL